MVTKIKNKTKKGENKNMTNEELRQKVLEVMQRDDCHEAYENLAEAFFNSVNTDDESYCDIGYHLLKAFLDGDVNAAMTAVSGWSLESLMVKAGILPDTEHIFN